MHRWLVPGALIALAASLGPGETMYLGMALGGGMVLLGRRAYRDACRPGSARLAGAGSMALGALALFLAFVRYALSYWAIGYLGAAIR